MKTLRLNRADSAAYANGERRFWRAMKPQPVDYDFNVGGVHPAIVAPQCEKGFEAVAIYAVNLGAIGLVKCPYGNPGDRIVLTTKGVLWDNKHTITAITVEQRGGRWGWVVEVGA